MNELVLIDQTDPRITIATLNRPEKRNALNVAMMRALREAVVQAEMDKARRAVIVRSTGPAFCAGMDLNEASSGAPGESSLALKELFETFWNSRLVIIGAAQGSALGGGAGLILACDVAVVADDFQIGFPEVRRGLVGALVACLLRRHVGDRAARQLLLLGQPLTANEAHTLPLLSKIVLRSRLDSEALLMAREVCAGAPDAMDKTKRLLDALGPRPLSEDLAMAMALHNEMRQSPEAAEGMAAFKEKRPPNWT